MLGGGIVEGGVVLIGGDPGIGKSTLLLQALDALQRARCRRSTSPARKAARRSRCARAGSGWTSSQVRVLAEIQLEKILATHRRRAAGGRGDRLDPDRVLRPADLGARLGRAGARMRGAADARAKSSGTTIVLVGHVTKEGALAGPRVPVARPVSGMNRGARAIIAAPMTTLTKNPARQEIQWARPRR